MSMKIKKPPVGVSDFMDMITGDFFYVDKTLFIKDIIDKGDKILLVPRPRRFGKTLNLSMLKYFYDCGQGMDAHKKLFQSLAILKAGKPYLDKMGKHPVIFISFRDIKEMEWDTCLDKVKRLIQDEYAKHYYLLKSKELLPPEKDYFQQVVDLKGSKGDYEKSLEKLLLFLNRHYGERVVILIDEYDAPVHAGFNHGYYEEVINFTRNFLCGGLKDTGQYLEKSVITGIMRVARESIFSGLNNIGVYTLLDQEFDDKFGFTENEMDAVLEDFNLLDRYDEVQKWYNGYQFGKRVIYNPWSIINFLGSRAAEMKPYWLNTSDNAVVESLLSNRGIELKEELEQLIRGEAIEKAIEEHIVLKDVYSDEDILWSFLLMGGYLKQTGGKRHNATGKMIYTLSIPNMEVRTAYTKIISRFFSNKIENRNLEIMLKALLDGDIDIFEEIFSDYVVRSMSFFDMGPQPEKVYHAFVMGLLLWLSPGYQVKSNRESGYGRYDIMIIPGEKSRLGFIIEFKNVRRNETVESAVESALKQIDEKMYEAELEQSGIKKYKKLAIVFNGKDVTIREGKRQS